MTGKDLIIYILQNDLENELIIKDDIFELFMSEEKAAIKFDVGVATIRAWYECGLLPGVKIGDSIFFLSNLEHPKRRDI